MREAFNLFDKDKDGRITCTELLTVMKELRQQASEDEIKDMITHADEDGNYTIHVSKLQYKTVQHSTIQWLLSLRSYGGCYKKLPPGVLHSSFKV